MATLITSPARTMQPKPGMSGHKKRLLLAWLLAAGVIAVLSVYGFPYYRLSMEERPLSPLHSLLRPSGAIGLRLGMLGVVMYCILFLYPIRKHWRWLGTIGKTRNWLDFHVLCGITTPIIITFHASFKLQGLVGVAYWIMIIVALSGFIGRFIYAQIPRSIHTVQLTIGEIQADAERLAAQLAEQRLFSAEEMAPLLEVPTPDQIRKMPLGAVLWTMLRLDVARPFRVSRLRRRILSGSEWITTFGGFLASRQVELEAIVCGLRSQSWLRAKTAFLERSQQVFQLWHVVHRPFSYSFVVLAIVHIAVVLMLGYY